uniref:Protein FRA10AC1 n=1 Tax=Chromera velia CCMP2878 TaxID=1169474 RepID=A0A0G4HCS7_9ALVE|eukprot:Cvel_6353.t1-p1 / transcript=Cvel_6353.t1 / gene=Cvel_6353 / organism=Chromera_velia_CCMP2878 / gene_product=Protein FRA10AC1 homolog, putative / transcript_product=Protein FRA10AC1 homolog, putative / location=Cvel_scaffold309:21984-25034(+) / protein_length=334 / sequence_SO=supercontig / SO=protein_coding / is_pseudo=false
MKASRFEQRGDHAPDLRKNESGKRSFQETLPPSHKPGASRFDLATAKKPDFLSEAVKASASSGLSSYDRLKGLGAYQRHLALGRFLGKGVGEKAGGATQSSSTSSFSRGLVKTDWDILKENHKFLRDEKAEDGSWEAKLAKRYYDKLYKEYVICDLSRYRKGQIGMRWRTEAEVIRGEGQFSCGNKHCSERHQLNSYEVNFAYKEDGQMKQALVKARLCPSCAYKLNYKYIKAWKKQRKAEKAWKKLKGEAKEERLKEEETGGRDGLFTDGVEREGVEEEEEREEEYNEEVAGEKKMDAATLRELEKLAWAGPRPEEAKTRQDEFDDFLKDMIL